MVESRERASSTPRLGERPNGYFLGLMTGTSIDGIDAAVIRLSEGSVPTLVGGHSAALDPALTAELHALCSPGDNEIERLARADRTLGKALADAALALLDELRIAPHDVCAIGSHGQTIRHRPQLERFTLQIGDANEIAEHTGIPTVADLRRRDIAAGGQGAPLAPAFHATLFGTADADQVVLNIGGIANATFLPRAPKGQPRHVTGHDTGPGNTLMDAWIRQALDRPFDDDGQWAATGTSDHDLLNALLSDPYFAARPPKSTGRELFHLNWLAERAPCPLRQYAPENVQATLLELTARTIVSDVIRSGLQPARVIACGGGRLNTTLSAAIQQRLQDESSGATVCSSDTLGWDGDYIEAGLCAWLAAQTIAHASGNLPSVTGATGARTLGGIYLP